MTAAALGLDAWWDEPAYKAAQVSFTAKRTFILDKLRAHDAAKLKDVLADVYRDAVPDPTHITKLEWEIILRFMGESRRDRGRAEAHGSGLAIVRSLLSWVAVRAEPVLPAPGMLKSGGAAGGISRRQAPLPRERR
jgi:hypothetical protein